MNNSIPKLGTPTKYGYRTSKGFVRKGDRFVQQTFWLGPNPAVALKKLAVVETAAAVQRDSVGRVIWTEEHVAALRQRLQSLDAVVIARALDLPVAAGETETTPFQFLPWFQQRGLDIAQPDVARCGISESMRIAGLADAFHVPVAFHSGILTAPGIAASLQVAAAIPILLYQEYQPVMTDLANGFLKRPIVCRDCGFELPAGPGLGIEINEEALPPHIVRGV